MTVSEPAFSLISGGNPLPVSRTHLGLCELLDPLAYLAWVPPSDVNKSSLSCASLSGLRRTYSYPTPLTKMPF